MLKFKMDGMGITKWVNDNGNTVSGYFVSSDKYDEGECYDLMGNWLAENEEKLFEKFNINPKYIKDYLE